MRIIQTIALLLLLASCKNENPVPVNHYKWSDKEDVGLLELSIREKRFYGKYSIHYSKYSTEEGEVSGEVIGDTLKGKFKYITYGGRKELAPFVLLKKGNEYVVGKGLTYKLFHIPYFSNESLTFNDQNLILDPISDSEYQNLK